LRLVGRQMKQTPFVQAKGPFPEGVHARVLEYAYVNKSVVRGRYVLHLILRRGGC
jgi:hypothetical protein